MSAREVPLGPAGTAVSRAFLKRGAFSQPSFLGVGGGGSRGGTRVHVPVSACLPHCCSSFLSPFSSHKARCSWELGVSR